MPVQTLYIRFSDGVKSNGPEPSLKGSFRCCEDSQQSRYPTTEHFIQNLTQISMHELLKAGGRKHIKVAISGRKYP